MGHIFYFPSEGRHAWGFLPHRKKSNGFGRDWTPRTRVQEASMLTTRPPKPSLLPLLLTPDFDYSVMHLLQKHRLCYIHQGCQRFAQSTYLLTVPLPATFNTTACLWHRCTSNITRTTQTVYQLAPQNVKLTIFFFSKTAMSTNYFLKKGYIDNKHVYIIFENLFTPIIYL
jgi:hypothetical protein